MWRMVTPLSFMYPASSYVGNRLVRILSKVSVIDTAVEFVNATPRPMDVIWVDYHGTETTYMTLECRESYEQPTYAAHAWRIAFADSYLRCV
ncbi:hypothetical protein H257_05483 [Aphanomyces astaci]|uniref:von Hippel-Lindau disease tumour suppressor beta domain-containing protein n=1 Tax=Aphanomyces astaci TaxID=112090 RepID=W4GQC6_APHAT|nr:hypothetical protein H257_05483 [Aphanomyces astaci]ETV81945.1 hypothetical protein H257_05483 [Aphanomyces astaci]|eukprot:XP_009828682.1 hypothetical protein H257_05483 [Aphanomyces astaci]